LAFSAAPLATATAGETAVAAAPAAGIAVTATASFLPSSEAGTVYVCVVAPLIAVPSASHW